MPKRRYNSGDQDIFSMNFPENEVLWIAGFYEGEGSCRVSHAQIAQTTLWPLERCRNTFGGAIYQRQYPNNPKHSQRWDWVIGGKEARDFIAAIYPHLSPRRQAQIDAKFMTWEKYRLRRRDVYQGRRERALNSRLILANPNNGRFRLAAQN